MTTTDTTTDAGYFAYDNTEHHAVHELAHTANPARRAQLLQTLGDIDRHKADLHTAEFGAAPYNDDDPTTHEEWLADSARMLWILAEAEWCRSQKTTAPIQSVGYHDRLDDRTLELQIAVDDLLDQYMTARRRRPLIRQMCEVWGEMTGGQANEGPFCLGLRMPWWTR